MSHKIACWIKDSLVSSIGLYKTTMSMQCSQSDEIKKDVL